MGVAVVFQGERGYDGPRGSRGPPGSGLKGDKVIRSVSDQTALGLQTWISCSVIDYLVCHIKCQSFLQGSHGLPGLPGLVGAAGVGPQGEKVKMD